MGCMKRLICARSNPMAGVDATLLALSGTGYADGRSFGFASCERAVGAAEVSVFGTRGPACVLAKQSPNRFCFRSGVQSSSTPIAGACADACLLVYEPVLYQSAT